MTLRRLSVAGGGGADDSRLLDEKFAAWLGTTGKMLYLPLAMDGRDPSYDACLHWVREVFARYEVTDIEMWTDLDAGREDQLDRFQAIYIGGGNTFRLLHLIRSSGFEAALANFVERGGAVYGGSAGAIILGRDISTCAHIDPNEVGLQNTAGLDFINGYAIWCHYRLEDDANIIRFVEAHQLAVLALSERSGLCLEDDHLLAMGFEGVRKFTRSRKQYIEVGQVFS
ncbi:MAG: Type 1 glutamine amidotransferase-like domain-containing protein [Anaerolineae bacterium]|nr:Type 1 glutamine amidotransferase-like domain-containing protein [Anaerolineae bacterium]